MYPNISFSMTMYDKGPRPWDVPRAPHNQNPALAAAHAVANESDMVKVNTAAAHAVANESDKVKVNTAAAHAVANESDGGRECFSSTFGLTEMEPQVLTLSAP